MTLRMASSLGSIVALRVVLLLAAAAIAVLGFVVGRKGAPPTEATIYVCPMHPEVTSSSPGDCPICGMALEPTNAQRTPITLRGGAITFSLPAGTELRSFDSVSKAKQFDSSLEMRGPAWAEDSETGAVLLHRDEVELLGANEEATFSLSDVGREGAKAIVKVHRTGEPPTPWDDATMLVRFRADPGATFTPGETGSVKFATRLRKGLVVRSGAILHSPEGAYVYVVANDRRTLTKRHVEVGNVMYGYADIVSGLREGEYVASIRTFFLDAERRLRTGASLP